MVSQSTSIQHCPGHFTKTRWLFLDVFYLNGDYKIVSDMEFKMKGEFTSSLTRFLGISQIFQPPPDMIIKYEINNEDEQEAIYLKGPVSEEIQVMVGFKL